MDKYKLSRTIFFWFLVTTFIIIAPVVVMHARGYRFDFSRGVFVYSGTITFKTNPSNVDVFLNKELNESERLNRINSSFNLTGLLPRKYDLEIAAQGFQSWRKSLDVHSGISTEFWNVVLVKNAYETETYNTTGVDNFFTSPRNKFLAYTQNKDTGLAVSILNIENNIQEISFLFPEKKFIYSWEKENIEWLPSDSSLISIPAYSLENSEENLQNKKYFIADIATGYYFELNQFLDLDEIKDVRWDPKDKNFLFFINENKLFRANIKNKEDFQLLAEDVSTFDISGDKIFYTQLSNNLIYEIGIGNGLSKKQITLNFPENNPEPISKIIAYDEDRIALIDNQENMFILNQTENDRYFKKMGDNIKGLHFSDDGKKLLFWSNNEISVYFLRDWEVQPIRQENDLINITRYFEKVSNVQWYKDYEHIIFNVGKYPKFVELDSRDNRNSMDFPPTQIDNPFIIYNSFLEKMFFTDQKDNQKYLHSFDFPEENTILGL